MNKNEQSVFENEHLINIFTIIYYDFGIFSSMSIV